jgi:hypothetical protein
LGLAVVVAVLVAAGCSNSADGNASSTADKSFGARSPSTTIASGGADAAAGGAGTAGGSSSGTGNVTEVGLPDLSNPVQAGRKVIYTGRVEVSVKDVNDGRDQAVAAAERAGGFLFGEDDETDGGRALRLTLKVPAAHFTEVLGEIRGLGKVRARKIQANDVTDDVVDLESRQQTLQRSITRLRDLFDRAGNVGEIGQIEGQLTQREAELESIEGRLRALQDQVELSTITAVLHPVAVAAHAAPHDRTGFRAGLRAGAGAALATGRAAAAAGGFLLPFTPLLAIAAMAAWLATRRRRRVGSAVGGEA